MIQVREGNIVQNIMSDFYIFSAEHGNNNEKVFFFNSMYFFNYISLICLKTHNKPKD